MTKLRRSLVKKVVAMSEPGTCGDDLVSFLAKETQMRRADVAALI